MTQHHLEYDAYLDDPDDDASDILTGPDGTTETTSVDEPVLELEG